MRKIISILTVIFCFISPLSIVKSQYKGINTFFEGDTIFYSLSNFINSNKITIVDKENKIFPNDVKFEHQTESGKQTLTITNSIPKEKNYLLLSDYIINQDLAVISFADSAKKKYIIYTFKKVPQHPEWWGILSVFRGTMN